MESAAYISREEYRDERQNLTFNYRELSPIQAAAAHDANRHYDEGQRLGAVAVGMAGPKDAPDWAFGRENIQEAWNRAEAAEKRKDAQIAERHIAALPKELTLEQNVWLVKDHIKQFTRDDRLVQWAIHQPEHGDGSNYHVHLLISTRGLDAEGFKLTKTAEQQARFLGQSDYAKQLRSSWEAMVNRHLQRHGHEARIDMRSHKEAGRDREPMLHIGPEGANSAERQRRIELNRAIQARNAARELQPDPPTPTPTAPAQRLREMAESHDQVQRGRQLSPEARQRIEQAAALPGELVKIERRGADRDLSAAIRTASPEKLLEALTRNCSTFTAAQLEKALEKHFPDPNERITAANTILSRSDVLGLRETESGPVQRYSTRATLAVEERLTRDAAALAGDVNHGLTETQRAAVQARSEHFNAEQRGAFEYATGAEGLAIISGQAGTGKSFTLSVVREAYEAAGYSVIGLSHTHRVVESLKEGGFQARTIASELHRLDSGKAQWNGSVVAIVDEAAMLSTRQLAAVAEHAKRAGAKVILAGDDRQLSSIDAGGMFGFLEQKHGAAVLSAVVRNADPLQQTAWSHAHDGRWRSALTIFDDQGLIHWAATPDAARTALIEQWARDSEAPDKIRFVTAVTNADVSHLNSELRDVRKARGELGEDRQLEAKDGPAPFAEGDRIQFTGTVAKDRIFNSHVGTIRSIGDDNRVTVAIDTKPGAPEHVVSFFAGTNQAIGEFSAFQHGYAGTIYKSQGATVEQSYLLHSEHMRQTTAYVGASRHSERGQIFTAAVDLDQLARQISRADEHRPASAFFIQENPEPALVVDLGERRTKVESARLARLAREAEKDPQIRERLERQSHVDKVHKGGRSLTVQDIAAQLSDVCREAPDKIYALNTQAVKIAEDLRYARAQQHHANVAAQHRLNAMNSVKRWAYNNMGIDDKKLAKLRNSASLASENVESQSVKLKATQDQLETWRGRQAEAFEQVRPEAERRLAELRRTAETARTVLAPIHELARQAREQSPARDFWQKMIDEDRALRESEGETQQQRHQHRQRGLGMGR